MKRALLRVLLLLALVSGACGCTVVVGRQPVTQATAAATEVVRPIEAYGTAAPTLTPTAPATMPVPATATDAPTLTPTVSPSPTATATAEPSPTPPFIYVVQKGDTLSQIAKDFGVSLEALIAANQLEDPSKLEIGDELVIPGSEPSPSPEAAEPLDTSTPAPSPTATVQEAAPTAAPSPTPFPSIESTPLPTSMPPAQGAAVSETTVSINIADYAGALYPLKPEDVGYPYDGLDFSKVGPVAPRQYRALLLENAYLSVVVVPDLGGRIYQITDRTNGRQMLYNNPAVIPSSWGMRGWWLAIGGVEWALPTEEHGLVEYLPWTATPAQGEGEASVLLSTTERLTGVQCQVRVSLDDEHSYVTIAPSVTNPGESAQRLQFWLTAAYAPGGTHVPAGTRLVFPATQLLVHDTSDPGLPAPGTTMPWPLYGPRDLSLPDSWHGFLGAFANPRAQAGFMGAQSPGEGGLLRVFPPEAATGAKFFGLGDIPYTRYSQADSTYLELWGGWTPSFWSYQELAAGQSFQWQERWYPLPDMAPVVTANSQAALAISQQDLAVTVTRAVEAEIEAFAGSQSLQVWRAALAPGTAWRAEEVPAGVTAVEVRERATGEVLLRWPG